MPVNFTTRFSILMRSERIKMKTWLQATGIVALALMPFGVILALAVVFAVETPFAAS